MPWQGKGIPRYPGYSTRKVNASGHGNETDGHEVLDPDLWGFAGNTINRAHVRQACVIVAEKYIVNNGWHRLCIGLKFS